MTKEGYERRVKRLVYFQVGLKSYCFANGGEMVGGGSRMEWEGEEEDLGGDKS